LPDSGEAGSFISRIRGDYEKDEIKS